MIAILLIIAQAQVLKNKIFLLNYFNGEITWWGFGIAVENSTEQVVKLFKKVQCSDP